MLAAQPSRTAFAAAMYRAAHQELDEAHLFRDPYAMRILGGAAQRRRALEFAGNRPLMRLFIAMRSRIAETKLAEATERGVRQIVVLGAGLDTLSLRNPFPEAALFEVDHPATQAWKRERLVQEGLSPGANVRFVPVDFEHQSLGDELAAAGFDRTAPAFYLWLGVVPYLTADAVFATLGFIAETRGNETVFDYANPLEQLTVGYRVAAEARAKRAARIGEPFLSHFDTAALHARLAGLGATAIDDFGPERLATLYGRPSPVGDRGGHVVGVRF